MEPTPAFSRCRSGLIGALLTSLLALSLARADTVLAIHDPVISYYWPTHGWASQAHAFGHDGWGSNNNPTYYGAVDTAAGYWPSVGGEPSVPGENGCAGNRWPNMNIAETRSEESTTDQPQLPDWPVGLLMFYVGCDVSEASYTQFTTWVTQMNGGGCCGATWHFAATAAQCSSLGMSFPCGDWASLAQLTISWWDTHTDVQRRKFLLHEWGHAWNLGDYCNPAHNAMSKNGTPSCPWPPQTKYYDLDDRGLFLSYGQ